jgi:hypothetical protein
MEQGDWFPATFLPKSDKSIDHLGPAAVDWVGWRGLWEASFLIEGGPFEGQWACVLHLKRDGTYSKYPHPGADAFAWVPEEDLEAIQLSGPQTGWVIEHAEMLLEQKFGPPDAP